MSFPHGPARSLLFPLSASEHTWAHRDWGQQNSDPFLLPPTPSPLKLSDLVHPFPPKVEREEESHHSSQGAMVVKNLPAGAGNGRGVGWIPGSGRSPGGGRGNPLQYSCLENPTDGGTWWATVRRVAESDTTEATLAQQSLCCILEVNTRISLNYTSVK